MHHPCYGAHLNELRRSLAGACEIPGEIIVEHSGALSVTSAARV